MKMNKVFTFCFNCKRGGERLLASDEFLVCDCGAHVSIFKLGTKVIKQEDGSVLVIPPDKGDQKQNVQT